jgi:RNA polymerase sigma factor for flagellar operon FliA
MKRRRPPSNIESAHRLAEVMAKKYSSTLGDAVPFDELRSFAGLGAADALHRWDGRGDFETFALQRIDWAILRSLRRQVLRQNDQQVRAEAFALFAAQRAADALVGRDDDSRPNLLEWADATIRGFVLELGLADEASRDETDPDEDVERNVERVRLRQAISRLPPPEDRVLERHCYGDESFQDIGEALGLSKSTVGDIFQRGVRRLQGALSADDAHEPAPSPPS